MSGFLLDTNMCSYAMRLQHGVADRLAAHDPSMLFVSVITLAEAWAGARRTDRRERIEAQWAYFLKPFRTRILTFDEVAADQYATARAILEGRGEMIGDRDCMLAATALAHDLTMVTRNVSELGRVPGLRVADWSADPGS